MNNKFCPSCGQKITEEGVFCINCGYNLGGSNNTSQSVVENVAPNNYGSNVNVNVVQQPTASNGMAVAGFVLGILSLCCCCYTSIIGILGLVFSIIGFNNSKTLPDNKGKGLAIAGIILSSVSLAIGLVSIFISLFGYLIY